MLIYTTIDDYYTARRKTLTPLQAQIVELIATKPHSAKEIAEKLNLKPDNVRAYISKASRLMDIYTDREKFWVKIIAFNPPSILPIRPEAEVRNDCTGGADISEIKRSAKRAANIK